MLQSLFASDFIENFPLFAIILCLLCAVISFVLSGSARADSPMFWFLWEWD